MSKVRPPYPAVFRQQMVELVQARQRLHRLDAAHNLFHVHPVQ